MQAVHLVVETVASRRLVVQACGAGQTAGIARGMSVAQARALVPSLTVHLHEHRPDLDRRLLVAMARWMLRVTPRVALDEPDGLILDLTGCGRLYADESAVRRRVEEELARLGLCVRVAIAGTVGAAWAVARHVRSDARGANVTPVAGRDPNIVASGEEGNALDPLPVAALRIGASAIDELAQVGIETIGQLRRVPRGELAGRGGGWREGGLLTRLDQAFGRRPERLEPVVPPLRPGVERIFAGPVLQPEAIIISARELLDELVVWLERLECGVTRLQVRCVCPDADPQVFDLRLGRPTRARRHLWTLLAPRLERVHLDYGVESLHLTALRIARLDHRQASCEGLMASGQAVPRPDGLPASREPAVADAAMRRRHEAALGELLDGLVDRLGPDRVLGMRRADSHVPEHAGEPVPLGEPTSPPIRIATHDEGMVGEGAGDDMPDGGGADGRPRAVHTLAVVSEEDDDRDPQDPHLGSPARRRPPQLLAPPEPLEIEGKHRDGTPRRIRWRDGAHLVVRAIGPERIAAPWWEARRLAGGGRGADPGTGLLVRDYFRVQDEYGRWIWIFRRMDLGRPGRGGGPPPTRWFLHGLWE